MSVIVNTSDEDDDGRNIEDGSSDEDAQSMEEKEEKAKLSINVILGAQTPSTMRILA